MKKELNYAFHKLHIVRTTLLAIATMTMCAPCPAQSNGLPTAFLARTLYLKNGDLTGSGFLIDYKDREYLVTARHIVVGLPTKNAKLQFYRSADWRDFTGDLLFPKNKNVDIAVLDIHQKPSMQWNPELTDETPTIGGQIYFVGYPHGLHTLYSNGEYLPLVKAGVFSGIDNSDPDDEVYYIDGFNNPGFSGGPVAYIDNTKHSWRICAVVKGYVNDTVKTQVKGKEIDTRLLVNSGILLAYPIDYALKAIDASLSK